MELFKLFGRIVIDSAEAQRELDGVSREARDTGEELERTSRTSRTSGDGMVSAFKKVGAAVVTYLSVDAIKNFGLGCINAAADASAMASQFSQVFGDLESNASKSLSSIADNTGINENRMKGSFTQIAAFAKTTGLDTESALALSERAMVAVADSAAFYDRSLEETTESLQSFLKGNFENDAALGLSCTETTRNAAANKLYGKSFKDLSESQKQLTLLAMVEEANELGGAMGQAARESDTWTNQIGNLRQAWKDFQSTIGSYILPMAVEVVKKMSAAVVELSEGVKSAIEWCSKHKEALTFIGIAVGTVTAAIGAYTIANKLKNIAVSAGVAAEGAATAAMGLHVIATNIATAATSAFGAVMAFITSPITLVVLAIGTMIAIIVLLAKHWDVVSETVSNAINNIKSKISNGLNSAKNTVTNVLNSIKSKFTSIFESVKTTVSNAIEKIKSYFNFEWSLPKLKMPHFSITGSFSLKPPSVPSFSVEWYKNAYDSPMLLDSPTIFGFNQATGNMMGGGDGNGTEVVSGANTLMNMIQGAVSTQNEATVYYLQRLIEILASYFPQILENMNREVVLDSGALVGSLAVPMNTALGKVALKKDRGR